MSYSGKIIKTLLFLAVTTPVPALAQVENSIPRIPSQAAYLAASSTPTQLPSASPVMIIRFNQKNVYFQNPIRKVVGKIDATKPASKYELLSVVPAGKTLNPGNDKEFDENLTNVIAVLNRFQVPMENISTRTETSNTVENQEVHLFVQ